MEKENKKKWRKELARDLAAFGSIPFLVLTVARVLGMGLYPLQFVLAAVLFFIAKKLIGADLRAGIGIILLGLTSLFYGSWFFVLFAFLVYSAMIYSLFYLGESKMMVAKGILLGAISAGIAYFAIKCIEKRFF